MPDAPDWKNEARAAVATVYAWAFDALARIGVSTEGAVLTPLGKYKARLTIGGDVFEARRSPFPVRTGLLGDYVLWVRPGPEGETLSKPLYTPADLGLALHDRGD